MLKSISKLSVLLVALVLIVGLRAEDPAKTCPGGACGGGACAKSDAKACAGCPAATAQAETGTCTKDCQACPAGKQCDGKDCKDCPITSAMAALPQITFIVGEEKTCCPKTAAELAQKANTTIHYMVCEKSYDAESDAKLALAEVTEQFVAAYAEPKACKETGKVTVCGKELCCEGTAAQTAAIAKAAMDTVAMTYMVGEKECHCPVEAAKLAKDSGDPTVFVVAGESTACNVTARLNLARAKYKAAVVAVVRAEAPAQEKLTSKDS
jgi:hypothetical protein